MAGRAGSHRIEYGLARVLESRGPTQLFKTQEKIVENSTTSQFAVLDAQHSSDHLLTAPVDSRTKVQFCAPAVADRRDGGCCSRLEMTGKFGLRMHLLRFQVV